MYLVLLCFAIFRQICKSANLSIFRCVYSGCSRVSALGQSEIPDSVPPNPLDPRRQGIIFLFTSF
jgi:hypothetical protein